MSNREQFYRTFALESLGRGPDGARREDRLEPLAVPEALVQAQTGLPPFLLLPDCMVEREALLTKLRAQLFDQDRAIAVQELVVSPLARALAAGRLASGQKVVLRYVDGELQLWIQGSRVTGEDRGHPALAIEGSLKRPLG